MAAWRSVRVLLRVVFAAFFLAAALTLQTHAAVAAPDAPDRPDEVGDPYYWPTEEQLDRFLEGRRAARSELE